MKNEYYFLIKIINIIFLSIQKKNNIKLKKNIKICQPQY